jgi:hypothetical protein
VRGSGQVLCSPSPHNPPPQHMLPTRTIACRENSEYWISHTVVDFISHPSLPTKTAKWKRIACSVRGTPWRWNMVSRAAGRVRCSHCQHNFRFSECLFVVLCL